MNAFASKPHARKRSVLIGTAERHLSRLSFDMMLCAYCGQEATMRIVANPEHVCFDHALEFWTGLLVYSRDASGTCVKQERLCTCPACEEVSASYLRASAIAAAGAPPAEHEHFLIRLAS
jgi:hypothetical protein